MASKYGRNGAVTEQPLMCTRRSTQAAIAPKLDDVGFRGTDFGICRDGHFYGAGAAAECAACHTYACRACDDIDQQATIPCPVCSADVCRRCLVAEHEVPQSVCVLCGDRACGECGRDPEVHCCAICNREMCSACRVSDLCPACDGLAPATQDRVERLPRKLALIGAAVLIGSDADAMTVLIDRGDAVEQAVIRGESIEKWTAFGRNFIDDAYRLRLSASPVVGAQIVPVSEPVSPEPPIDAPHLTVDSHRSYRALWFVDPLGLSEWYDELQYPCQRSQPRPCGCVSASSPCAASNCRYTPSDNRCDGVGSVTSNCRDEIGVALQWFGPRGSRFRTAYADI
jgi:hypothetical protein